MSAPQESIDPVMRSRRTRNDTVHLVTPVIFRLCRKLRAERVYILATTTRDYLSDRSAVGGEGNEFL